MKKYLFIILFSFFILSCSGEEPLGTESSNCDNNGLCNSGLVCNNANKCIEKDVACKYVKCSNHGECIVENSKVVCECDTNYHTQGLNCISDSNPNECAESTDNCNENANCIDLDNGFRCECKNGFSGDGVTCNPVGDCFNNSDCDNGKICENYTCVENITSCNPACEDWQNCDDGYCELKADRCVTSGACGNDKICENHYCVDNVTTCNPACEEWQNCDSGYCEIKVDRCVSNSSCYNGKICKNHYCVENSTNCNPACEDWEDCDAGSCNLKANRCVSDNNCVAGKICNNHYCVNEEIPECRIDGDCANNQSCENNQCVDDNCSPKTCNQLNIECGNSSDGCGASLNCGTCSNNETCSNGRCITEQCVTTKRFEAGALRLDENENISLCSSLLVMQGDGNLVLYKVANEAITGVIWNAGTNGVEGSNGAYFNFQNDGNMVVYKSGEPLGGVSLWNSETSSWHRPNDFGHHLIIDNEKMELYDSNNNVIWTTFNVSVAVMNDLLSASTSSASVEVGGYFAVGDGGGGTFIWDATKNKAEADGGVVVDPSVSLAAQGTGVGAGCWVRQFTGAVNILWFGVDSTGSSDTRNKLISSFKYTNVLIPNGVKILSFPINYPNTINLEVNGQLTFAGENQNSAFTLNGAGTHILGTGIIQADVGNAYNNLIKVKAANFIIENIELTAVHVVGDPGGSECSYSDGCHGITYGRGAIMVESGENIIIKNTEIHHWFGAAVYLAEGSNCKILNNYFHDNTLGMFWGRGRDLLVDGNRILHNRNVSHPRGVLAGGSGIVTSASASAGGNDGERIIFTNNEVAENGEHGTYIHSKTATITGNYVHHNYYQGIKVDCPGDVLIENNRVEYNDPNKGDGDIYIQARWQMNGVTVKNNHIISLAHIASDSGKKVVSMKAVIYEWHETAGLKNIKFINNTSNGFFHVEYTSGFENTNNTYNGYYFHQEGH